MAQIPFAVALAKTWLWCKPAATVPIRPLAWESPHAAGAALEKTTNRQKKKKKKKKKKTSKIFCSHPPHSEKL